MKKISANGINVFDIPVRTEKHVSQPACNPEFGFQQQKCHKTKGRKRNPVVKDLNDSSVFVSGKLTLKIKTGSFSFLFPSYLFDIYFFTKSVISFSNSES